MEVASGYRLAILGICDSRSTLHELAVTGRGYKPDDLTNLTNNACELCSDVGAQACSSVDAAFEVDIESAAPGFWLNPVVNSLAHEG